MLNSIRHIITISFVFFSLILNAKPENSIKTQRQRDIDSCEFYLDYSKKMRGTDLLEAEDYCKKALEFALLSNDEKLLARVYLQLGYYNQMNNQSSENIEYFFESLKIADKLGDDTLIAKIYNNIGGSYFIYGKNAKALEYFRKSLPIAKKLGIEKMLAVQYNNIGLIHAAMLDYDSANTYYSKAVKINSLLQQDTALVFNYGNIGYAFGERKMYDSSYFYYIKQKEIAEKIKDKVSLTDSYTAISQYFLIKGNFERAISYADSSFAAGKESGYIQAFTEPFNIKADALTRLGRNQEAIQIYKAQKNYMDSIQEIRLKKLSSNIEMKYNYEQQRKQMEIERQDDKLDAKDLRLKIGFLIILLIIIPLIILSFLFYLKYKERTRIFQNKVLEAETEKLQLEAESKSKNLTTSILHEISKNDVVNRSIEKLRKNKPNFSKENQPVIEDIMKQLQKRVNKNIWNEFKSSFEKVHVSFYDNLLKEHPTLTPNEKRLSAFIRLNISSKDISSLTGQNVHSIEVARTRLRKKLNLANTNVNLVTFMEQF